TPLPPRFSRTAARSPTARPPAAAKARSSPAQAWPPATGSPSPGRSSSCTAPSNPDASRSSGICWWPESVGGLRRRLLGLLELATLRQRALVGDVGDAA